MGKNIFRRKIFFFGYHEYKTFKKSCFKYVAGLMSILKTAFMSVNTLKRKSGPETEPPFYLIKR